MNANRKRRRMAAATTSKKNGTSEPKEIIEATAEVAVVEKEVEEGVKVSEELLDTIRKINQSTLEARVMLAKNVEESVLIESSIESAEIRLDALEKNRMSLLAEINEQQGELQSTARAAIDAGGADFGSTPAWTVDFENGLIKPAVSAPSN